MTHPALGPGHPVGRRGVLGPDGDPDENGKGQKDADDDPRHDPGDQQLGDRGLGGDTIDDKGHAGRNQQVERGPNAHRTGRQLFRIAVAPHFRVSDRGHDRRRGHTRSRHRPEDPAGKDRCHPQAAPDVGKAVRPGLEKITGKTARCREIRHEHEHGDGGQGIIGDRRKRGHPQNPHHLAPAPGDEIDAQNAGPGKRKGDRDAEKKGDDHNDKRKSHHYCLTSVNGLIRLDQLVGDSSLNREDFPFLTLRRSSSMARDMKNRPAGTMK